jgi:hypothetical protein
MDNWKDIPGYEGIYTINSEGTVHGIAKNTIRKATLRKNGYYFVALYKNRCYKTFKRARLVASVFLPNPMNLPMINHIDGNKGNDMVDNLEWCDQSHNQIHACKMGLMGGEKHASAKLTKIQVRTIKHRLDNGEGPYIISKDYPVTGVAISRIKYHKSWKYV